MELIKSLKRKLGIGISKKNAVQAGGTTTQPALKERPMPSLVKEPNQNDPAIDAEESSIQTETGVKCQDEQSPSHSDNDDVPIRDLWNLAYERLREEDEQLIKSYEDKIQQNLNTVSSDPIDSKSSVRDQMDAILRDKMDEVKKNSWKLRFGSSETQVKDLVQPVLAVINWANDYIAGVLASNPCASMAWAGVSLLLPVNELRNISSTEL
jgi:hypothetical protein